MTLLSATAHERRAYQPISNIKTPNKLTYIVSFTSGMIFALGLIVAQMVNPNKVVAFLNILNNWDPSLALVMCAAIMVATPAFIVAKRKQAKYIRALDGSFIELPSNKKITPQLIIGSVIFGIGWGLLGFCPAPALVTALAGYWQAILFLVAMLVGFGLHSLVDGLMIDR